MFAVLTFFAIIALLVFCVVLIALLCRWVSSGDDDVSGQIKLEIERERRIREYHVEEEMKREAEQLEAEERKAQQLERIQEIFSAHPWNLWPPETHDGKYQMRRIERAFNSQRMSVLSYCPLDYSARINGDHEEIYKVTPMKCECPDFEKRLLPCKHMYYLALKLFDGFDESTYVGEDCPILSSQEKELQRNKKIAESSVLNKDVLKYLHTNSPASVHDIKKHFSVLNGNDVGNAINRLYSIGSIAREKGSNGRYQYFIPTEKRPCPDLFPVVLPTFPPYPAVPSQYRGRTNMGTFEVHGTNRLTGKEKKVTVYALDDADAKRYAHLYSGLDEPLSAVEVISPLASDAQREYIFSLFILSGNRYDNEPVLTSVDAGALIEKGRRCKLEEEHIYDDYDKMKQRDAHFMEHLNCRISEDEWNEACLARVYASMYFDHHDYENAVSGRRYRTY